MQYAGVLGAGLPACTLRMCRAFALKTRYSLLLAALGVALGLGCQCTVTPPASDAVRRVDGDTSDSALQFRIRSYVIFRLQLERQCGCGPAPALSKIRLGVG